MCSPLSTTRGVSVHSDNLSKKLSENGVKVIPYYFYKKDFNSLLLNNFHKIYGRTMGLLIEAIRLRKEYDIIHIQASGGISSFISSAFGVICSKICNKKLFVTFHYRASEKFVSNYKAVFSYVLKNTTVFFVVSKKQKEIIEKLIPSFNNIVIIPNGFDKKIFKKLNKIDCRNKLQIPLDKKILLSVGNLLEEKGHKYLIESMKYVVAVKPDVLCIIVGDGKLRNMLEKQIKDEGLDNYCMLIGAKPHEEIPAWINACDLFVFPSLVESFGMAQVEAMACGKPVVSTKNGGSEEIIISKDLGLLCDTFNSKSLSDNILIALDNRWDSYAIAEYAMQFEWKSIAKYTISLYTSL
jgi:glycosyltransferase involved in cell wall biosynthesis